MLSPANVHSKPFTSGPGTTRLALPLTGRTLAPCIKNATGWSESRRFGQYRAGTRHRENFCAIGLFSSHTERPGPLLLYVVLEVAGTVCSCASTSRRERSTVLLHNGGSMVAASSLVTIGGCIYACRRRCKLPRLGRCKNPYPVPPIGGLVRLTSLAIGVV
jgi:hypothetical protein